MKLVFAIVHDEDGPKVMEELNRNGFSVTKLCSTGGFLKAGNTTLLVGVDESTSMKSSRSSRKSPGAESRSSIPT